jgi:hypothetical protein
MDFMKSEKYVRGRFPRVIIHPRPHDTVAGGTNKGAATGGSSGGATGADEFGAVVGAAARGAA